MIPGNQSDRSGRSLRGNGRCTTRRSTLPRAPPPPLPPPPARKSLTTSRWPPVPRLAVRVPRNAAKWQRCRSNSRNLSIGGPGLRRVVEGLHRCMTAVLHCRRVVYSQSPLSFHDTVVTDLSSIALGDITLSAPCSRCVRRAMFRRRRSLPS